METQNIMGTKKTLPLLLSMSLPVVLSMLIQALYNIVDSLWVTRLGTDALTAVSLAFPLQNIIMSAGVGMGIGISALVSIQLGAGRREEASRTASMGVALVLVHCVLFFLAGVFITKPFLRMFTDDPQIFAWACDYTQIVLCLSFGELIQMCFEKIFQGAGKMTTTMFLMASGCIINMILDPILIFGMFGLPAMGVRGAALATVIGQIAAMVLYFIVYACKDIGLSIHPRYVSRDWNRIREIYGVGIPSSLMLAMPSLLTGLLNGVLAGLGSVYVAVFGLYFKLQTFINMPANGVVQGMRPIVSYNYGARQYDRVRQTISYSTIIVAAITALGTVIAMGFPRQVLTFLGADAALLAAGVPALRIIGISFLLSTVSLVACGVFEALGRGRISLVISMLRQLVVLVPVGMVLSHFWGATGIWVAFPIAEAVTLVPALGRMRQLERELG